MVRAFPALWLLGALILGIAFAELFAPPCWLFPLIAVGSLVAGLLKRSQWYGIAALLCILAAYAGTRYCLEHQQGGVRSLQRLADTEQTFTIFATVDDWPRLRERTTDIALDIDSLIADRICYRVDGGLLLQVSDTTTLLRRGDAVVFTSRIYPLPVTRQSDFDYGRYLRLEGIHGRTFLTTLLNVRIDRRNPLGFLPLVDRLREATIAVFDRCLSPPSAALAKGLLLGETREIDPEVYAMFRDSGTLHLLAVSGSNVALVLLVIHLLLRPLHFRPRIRYVILLLVIVIYAGMCRGEPSVIRASVMATLVIGGRLLQRKTNLNQVIALTAVLILLYEPAQLFDVGFQLSFVTAWGLIFIVPRITALFEKHHQAHWYRWLVFPLIVSLIAQVCSTPLIVLYFHRLPVISIPANLIIVPLVSICVFGLAALLAAWLVLPLLGQFVGSLVDPIHRAVIATLELMGGNQMPIIEPHLSRFGEFAWVVVVLLYVMIVVAAIAIRRKQARRYLVFGLVMLLLLLVSTELYDQYNRHEQVVFVRIPGGVAVINPLGQGEADLVVTSLITRDYAIDELVLAPLLKRDEVDSLSRIFILGADYGALDDLWRLASNAQADSLLVLTTLLPGFIETRPAGGDSPPVVALSQTETLHTVAGYRFAADWLYCRRPGLHLIIAGPGARPDVLQSPESPAAVVFGSSRTLSDAAFERLREAGFGPVIAGSPPAFTISPDSTRGSVAAGPDRGELIDLKSLGRFTLSIPDRKLPCAGR